MNPSRAWPPPLRRRGLAPRRLRAGGALRHVRGRQRRPTSCLSGVNRLWGATTARRRETCCIPESPIGGAMEAALQRPCPAHPRCRHINGGPRARNLYPGEQFRGGGGPMAGADSARASGQRGTGTRPIKFHARLLHTSNPPAPPQASRRHAASPPQAGSARETNPGSELKTAPNGRRFVCGYPRRRAAEWRPDPAPAGCPRHLGGLHLGHARLPRGCGP